MLIHISEKARSDLLFYTAYKRRFSKSSSQKFLNNFYSSIELLKMFPYMHSKIDSDFDYRKVLFNKNFLIVYLINNKTILIDSIINCKKNYTNKFYFIV